MCAVPSGSWGGRWLSLEGEVTVNHQVSREDDRLTDSVQRGLRSGLPARARFLHAAST